MLPPKIVEKLGRRIEKLKQWRYVHVAEVPLEMAATMEHFRVPPVSLQYVPAPVGCTWGEHWGTTWFRGHIDVPRSCKGKRVFYRHGSHTDKLLWLDGEAFAGMNHGHEEVLLHRNARGGESHEIYVEAYTGHLMPGMDPFQDVMYTHQFTERDPGVEPPLPLESSVLMVEREHAAALYYDADVLYRTAIMLDESSLRRARLLAALNEALNHVPMAWKDESELESAAALARKESVWPRSWPRRMVPPHPPWVLWATATSISVGSGP